MTSAVKLFTMVKEPAGKDHDLITIWPRLGQGNQESTRLGLLSCKVRAGASAGPVDLVARQLFFLQLKSAESIKFVVRVQLS